MDLCQIFFVGLGEKTCSLQPALKSNAPVLQNAPFKKKVSKLWWLRPQSLEILSTPTVLLKNVLTLKQSFCEFDPLLSRQVFQ